MPPAVHPVRRERSGSVTIVSPAASPLPSFRREDQGASSPTMTRVLRRLGIKGAACRQREMVYVLGASGVGKSTWIKRNLARTHRIIDPDIMVKDCPLEDPHPEAVNSASFVWAKQQSDDLLEAVLASTDGHSIAFPGTGKGTCKRGCMSKKCDYILRAKRAGFKTRCVFLTCPREIALTRNATRPRRLPDELVDTSLESAALAFEFLREIVDVAEEHDTSVHSAMLQGRSMSNSRGSLSFSNAAGTAGK